MKPWITEAIGTQNVVLPSSVCQALLATAEKLSMPGDVVRRDARLPFLKRSSEASNGRQAIRSPAVPPVELRVQRGIVLRRRQSA